MTALNKQALREAAEKAGKDKWQAKKINGDFYVIRSGSYIKQCGITSYQPIAEIDHKPVRDFVAMVNPATTLALLDELDVKEEQRANWFRMAQKLGEDLDAAEKRNAEQQRSLDHRKFLLLSADEVQRDFAEALGCAGDNESIMEAIDDLKQHIAELESKNANLRTIAHEQNELAIRANLDSINDAVEMDRLHKRIAETDQRNAELTARIEPMDRRIAELERSETQLINERDNAESALNDAYKAVMGQAPEWSNWFSFENAIDEIELACELWRNQTDDVIQFRQRIQELEAKLETADKLQDSAFRDGLKAGFSYGQTDDQSGFTQCMSAYSTRAGIKVKG